MEGKKKNLNLSVLRIVAMLMVFSIHVGIATSWTKFVGSGKYGVQLFFIMSGYLICISLENSDSIKEYYRKRIRRLVPEYYTALIICWLIDMWRYAENTGIAYAVAGWNAPLGIRYFLRYFSFFQMILPSENSGLWNNRYAWWTMSSFAVFYLLAPFFFRYLKGFYRSFAALFLLLAGTPVARSIFVNFFQNFQFPAEAEIEGYCECMPLMQLYCFFLGIVVYWAIREGKEMFYAVFLILLFTVFHGGAYPFEIILTLFLLVAVKAKEIQIPDWLEKVIDYMARGSFSVYLIHAGIMSMMNVWGDGKLSGAAGFCVVFLTVLVVCYLYYALYEKACQKLREYKKKRL